MVLICGLALVSSIYAISESEMTKILEDYNKDAQSFCNKQVVAEWAFQTDVNNDEKQQAAVSDQSLPRSHNTIKPF